MSRRRALWVLVAVLGVLTAAGIGGSDLRVLRAVLRLVGVMF